MTRADQREFVTDLVGNVLGSLLRDMGRVPEGWDGHELRQWIASRFERERTAVLSGSASRRRKYTNAIITNNL